jgi:Flp pilus assembly protein TadG
MQSPRQIKRASQRTRSAEPRAGVAAVEFAVCLPLMMLITFGAIEAANGIYLKQIATQVAYEAARVASTPGCTDADARSVAEQILSARKVKDAQVVISPQVTAKTQSGTEIMVTVTAPSNSNAYAPLWYFRDAQLTARVVMVRN